MKKKILVVDDEESIRLVVSFTLEQAGYDVENAANGDDCLEKVYSFSPDLVLLDLMMPLVDGWEVLNLLRSNPETERIPVILLTAKGEIRDKMFALQQGASDYVTKPFSKEELLSRISQALV
ncbi:MAG: response regulator [Candidatus Zixiibacteriota bacterium]|jgi:DNA-binding response OmpR family regulator